jgi:Cu2+-exporting ATPase
MSTVGVATTTPSHRLADKPELVERVTRAAASGAREVELYVADMHCSSCTQQIRAALRHAGVANVRFNLARRIAGVTYDPGRTTLIGIVDAIDRAGFSPTFAGVAVDDPGAALARRRDLKRLGVAGIAMMQVMMFAVGGYAGALQGISPFYASMLRWSSLVFTIPVLLYSAQPFFTNALTSLRSWFLIRGSVGSRPGLAMDVPVALALAFAFIVSLHATLVGDGAVYFDSVTMFTFFLLAARFLEQGVRHRLTRLDRWLAVFPEHALRIGSDGPERVLIDRIVAGDRVIVPAGGRIPVDGTVIDGTSDVDEAALTGESIPVSKRSAAPVFAGTVNLGQPLTMVASSPRSGTRLAAIQRLAMRATLERPAIATLTDRLATHFVAALLVLATVTAVAWLMIEPSHAIPATIAVLVVSCPCALSLATPAAITAATVALRRCGFVVTRAHALERLAQADTVVFDKTGTLTTGESELVTTVTNGALEASNCVAIAAALEQRANHPLQHAFVTSAERARTPLPLAEQVTVYPGAGVEGVIARDRYRLGHAAFCGVDAPTIDDETHVCLARVEPGRVVPVADFVIRDELRADASAAVRELRALGLSVVALSGDAPGPCRAVARALGVDVQSRITPEAKLEHVRRLVQRGHRVVMVGDGLNDVPGLAAATVSIAPVEGTDIACSTADAMVLSRGVFPLVRAVAVARRTLRIVRQNLGWAFAYNLVCIPLAALGFVPAWAAAAGMSASSLLVTLNALRLAREPRGVAWKS